MMKKLFAFFVLLICVAVNADVLLDDNFNYPDGSLVDNAAWNSTSVDTTVGELQVDGGKIFVVDGNTEDVYATFTEQTSGEIYAGFDINVSAANTGEYFFHYKPSSGTYYRSRLYVVAKDTGFQFAINYNSSSLAYASFTSQTYDFNTTYRVVVGVDFANKISSLTVVDTGDTISATYTYVVDPIDGVSIRQRTYTGDLSIDNLIVATTFSEVTPNSTMVIVPDVAGMSSTAAQSAIESAGLTAVIADAYSDDVPVGGFVSQDPASGEELVMGGVVTVYYSLGSAPDFNAMAYGWEDGASPSLFDSNVTSEFTSEEKTSGSSAVKLTKTSGSTAYIKAASVTGLNPGDQVSAAVRLQYHGTNTTYGTRLWASGYSDVGGPSQGYTSASWGTQSFTWTTSGTTLDVQIRCYGATDEYSYADDLNITAPGYATITFPGTGVSVEPNVPVIDFTEWTDPDASYGWENNGIDVGRGSNIETRNDKNDFNSGFSSLKATLKSDDNSQAYLAKISGLSDGDIVRARIMAKKGESEGLGVRLWGHYEVDGSNVASAEGNLTLCDDDWTMLGHEWTFDDGDANDRDTLVVDAKLYSNEGDYGWVDDLELWVPEGATITFPQEPNDPICYLENDLTGDCTVDMADFTVVADSWMEDGYGVPDPNANSMFYKFYKYGWDDGKTAMETYPHSSWDEPNQIPVVENIVDPEDTSNKLLKVTSSTWDTAQIMLAQVDSLQDGDQVYVAVKWKDDFADEVPSLRLGYFHQTDGGYAGDKVDWLPIYSDTEWKYSTALFTFDVGDPARDGLKIVAYTVNNYTPDLVCGYIDEIIVSVPYHEDEFGNDLSGKVMFQTSPIAYGTLVSSIETLPEVCLANPDNDIVRSNDSYCIVDVADLAVILSEWLDCDWSDSSLCETIE